MLTPGNDITDDLLISYLLGEADEDVRKKVEAWITDDRQNLRYFENFRLIWETSKNIQLPGNIDADQAWQRFRQRTEKAQTKVAPVRNISAYASQLRIAATVLLCISVLGLCYYLWNKNSGSAVTFASLELSKIDTLPDGSVVTLNKHSAITYAGKFKNNRKIILRGEAFFNVAHDKSNPFTINVNDVKVTVVGTSFNIKSTTRNTEIIVETGTVKVEKNGRTVTLNKGEKLITTETKDSLISTKTNDRLYNYYRTHEFVCDGTPLWKLVETLNEAYGSNIVIENKALRSLPLTTTFSNEPLDKILSVISETFNITVERKENSIRLK